jgi:hypothetical protein
MVWYVLHRWGLRASIVRAPSEDTALQAASDLIRRGAFIDEVGFFVGRRRKVLLSGARAMEQIQNLAAGRSGAA